MRKVAVIGLGNIADRHRRNLKKIFPNTLVYSMSSSNRVLDKLVSNCDGYLPDIDSVISANVELAIVASPATFHLKHSRQLLEAGIPTLIEKPVTASFKDAIELQCIASENATPTAVGYCLRYLPSAIIVKKIVEDGLLGHIYNVNIEIGQYLPDWRQSKSYRDSVSSSKHLGGGALLELSHEFDYAQWLFGDLHVISSVMRSSAELEMDVEALADVMAVNTNGTIVNFHLDFLQKAPWRQCHLIGKNGRLIWDLIRNEVVFYANQREEIIYSEPGWDKNKLYINMLQDFIGKMAGQKNNCASLESSIKIVEIIDKIKETGRYI